MRISINKSTAVETKNVVMCFILFCFMQVNMQSVTFTDSRAKEFVDIVKKRNHKNLLKLYYNYKGFYMTGSADFVQGVVVEFLEKHCIEIKNNTTQPNQIKLQPNPKKSDIFNRVKSMFTGNSNKFGDNWNIDFEDLQSNPHHASKICETNYGCNKGTSHIPTIFQSHLYFRKQKYYLELLSDPFYSTDTVKVLFSCFLDILHKKTTFNLGKNSWNFTLYSLHSNDIASIIYLLFEYDYTSNKHILKTTKIHSNLSIILNDMHNKNKYMTTFLTNYECTAGLETGGAHAVTCGIIKNDRDVFVFILDSNGAQIEKSSWWQKYATEIYKTSQVQVQVEFQDFFNEHIVDVIEQQIIHKYPNTYNFIYLDGDKINLNPYEIIVDQQGGYCVLISYFFMHILYNNISIHNRNIFENIQDISKIIEYIEDLMIFIKTLINTDPFTSTQFFYNYCINIFRFMLSLNSMENFYEVHDVNQTKDIVNAEFANNPHWKHLYLPVESGDLMSLYMKLILQGQHCLNSLIGIPKLSNKSNYKQLLKAKNYSCIRFYIPSRKNDSIFDQPLRLFFSNDTEQVEFRNNSVFIMDMNADRRQYKNEDYLNQVMMIMDPSVVFINLAKVNDILNIPGRYRTMIKDFSILNPLRVHNSTTICLNTNYPITTKQEKTTNTITDTKKQSNILSEKNEYMITLSKYFNAHQKDNFGRDVITFINSKFTINNNFKINTLYRAFKNQDEYLSQLSDITENKYYFNAYYINKQGEKDFKDYGPGFYTLGSISDKVSKLLQYRISLRYLRKNCKCAILNRNFNVLLMIREFKNKFIHSLMNILNMDENSFDTYLYRNENFLALFYTYFRSIGVKFVLFFSRLYETWIHVYIDEHYSVLKETPFTVLDTTHAY